MPKVLIVDDQPENVKLLANMLIKQKIDVEFALNGSNALSFLEHDSFDLLLLDVMMPDMDGFEVCRQIKEKPHLKHIPVIFLTALNDTENIIKAFEVGAQDYISKPFNQPELIARVFANLELKLAHDKLNNLNHFLEDEVRKRTLELELMNKELIASDNAKTEFLAVISNDIREPLNNIMEIIHVLKDLAETKTIVGLINNLDKSVNKLESYSNLARLITGIRTRQVQLNLSMIKEAEFIDFCLLNVMEEITRKNIVVQRRIEPMVLIFKGDFDLLLTGICQMLKTYIRHTGYNSHLTIQTIIEDGMLNIEIIFLQPNSAPIIRQQELQTESLEVTFMHQLAELHSGRFELNSEKQAFKLMLPANNNQ